MGLMVKPINWGGMLEPYLQPLKERLGMLPLGQYEDGSVRLAWPGMLADTFSKGMAAAETPIPAINDDQAWADKSAAMFDMTSLAPMAGAGVAMTGALDNALGSAGGNLMKGASDLPMDLASRMARAKEMGFDTSRPVYHGSDAVFDEFDISRAGQSSGSGGFLGAGAYFADSPSMASNYGQNVGEYFIRPGRQLDMTQPGSRIAQELPDLRMQDGTPWAEAFAKKDAINSAITDVKVFPDGKGWAEVQYKVGGDWKAIPNRVSEMEVSGDGGRSRALSHAMQEAGLSDPENIGAIGNYFGAQNVTEAARKAGFDSAKAPGSNFWDGGNEFVAFDPRNIRSVNAAFDPARSDSANLLAANAKQGAAVPLAIDAAERAQPQGIRAYHGSPHDFDRFSLDQIGTGEGAQAYGHGLYFADSEDVARGYRDKLSDPNIIIPGRYAGPEISDDVLSGRAGRLAKSALGQYYENPVDDAIRALENNKRHVVDEAALPDYDAAVAFLRNADRTKNPMGGKMYEVNIKANPEDFLDWDKPLSQQSEAVKNALRMVRDKTTGQPPLRSDQPLAINNILGEKALSGDLGNMPAETVRGALKQMGLDVDSALREAGIPGIRYLDGMSRQNVDVNELRGTVSMWERAARKSPNDAYAQQMLADAQKALADAEKPLSSNYVVFDDARIDILRKYANAPTGAAIPAGMEAAQSDDPQTLTTANILRLLMGGK
jgi:hypothetical protein